MTTHQFSPCLKFVASCAHALYYTGLLFKVSHRILTQVGLMVGMADFMPYQSQFFKHRYFDGIPSFSLSWATKKSLQIPIDCQGTYSMNLFLQNTRTAEELLHEDGIVTCLKSDKKCVQGLFQTYTLAVMGSGLELCLSLRISRLFWS